MFPELSNGQYTGQEFYFRSGKPFLAVMRPPEDSEVFSIGFDDTDSATLGMCTTYLSTMMIERLIDDGVIFGLWDLPNLVRLNPQVPNKTRGNGALVLRLFTDQGQSKLVFDIAKDLVRNSAALEDDKTNPGIALMIGRAIPRNVRALYNLALHRLVSMEEVRNTAESEGIECWGMKKGLGIIGATAALGVDFSSDQTFEMIAYRDPTIKDRKRDIDTSLVLEVDEKVDGAFFNYDYENEKVCITPNSPCPVKFGARGETPEAVRDAYETIDSGAPRAVLFRTNQHTDFHIEREKSISNIQPFSSVRTVGKVSSSPSPIKGGHVILSIKDSTGKIDCAAYEPTKGFRNEVRKLVEGDVIEVWGSVRPSDSDHGPTINMEKMRVLSLVDSRRENPHCPLCGSRLTSMGSSGGFKCKRSGCKFRDPNMVKVKVPQRRELEKGRMYEVPPIAWRHLYKPLRRIK